MVGTRRGVRPASGPGAARAYFAAQALVGIGWWIGVVTSDDLRVRTLGGWRPELLAGPDLALYVGASAVAAAVGSRRAAVVATAWTVGLTLVLTGYALVRREAGWGALLMAAAAVGSVAATTVLRHGRLRLDWLFVGPFAFRVARAGSRRGYLARSLGQLVVFWAVCFGVAPVLLAWGERRLRLGWSALHGAGWQWTGALLFVAASALGIHACLAMALRGHGTPLPAAAARRLVVAGPYRWLRNPMAAAGALQASGVALVLGSWLVLVVTLAGAVAWQVVIRPVEEADLAARFGPDYTAYRERVGLWLPRVRRRGLSPSR